MRLVAPAISYSKRSRAASALGLAPAVFWSLSELRDADSGSSGRAMEVRSLRVERSRSDHCVSGTLRWSNSDASMILKWPHPKIDQDWDSGHHQWRKITPLAYCERKKSPLLYKTEDVFMQSEPVDILPDGEGLYVCCRKSGGYCFARLAWFSGG